jgi:hypothetical protein
LTEGSSPRLWVPKTPQPTLAPVKVAPELVRSKADWEVGSEGFQYPMFTADPDFSHIEQLFSDADSLGEHSFCLDNSLFLNFLGPIKKMGKFLKKFGDFKACFIALSEEGKVLRKSYLEATIPVGVGGKQISTKLEFPCSIPFELVNQSLCYPNKGSLTFIKQILPTFNKKITFGMFGSLEVKLVFTIFTTMKFVQNQDDMDVSVSVGGDATMTIKTQLGNIGSTGTISGTVTFKKCKIETFTCDGDTQLALTGSFDAEIAGGGDLLGVSQKFKVSCSATENFATIIKPNFSWADVDWKCNADSVGDVYDTVVEVANSGAAGQIVEDLYTFATDTVSTLSTALMTLW